VEKLPTQVIALGTRQVGEVACRIPNGDGKLPPGANVQAEIESKVVESALVVPKSALRREGAEWGVFVLAGNKVEWRRVTLGTSSVTLAEISGGVKEGDAVALATESPLKSGNPVIPRFP
jgi:HlyD family secretion protein